MSPFLTSRLLSSGFKDTTVPTILAVTLLIHYVDADKVSLVGVSRLRNCGPLHDLCSRRTLGKSPSSDSKASGCLCDANCFEFGDCCFDTAVTSSTVSPSGRWTCDFINRNTSVFVVSSCGNDTDVGYLNDLCPSLPVKSRFYDYTFDVPVLSHSTGNFYKNVYCALCNGQNMSDLASIGLEFYCNRNATSFKQFIETAKYHPRERRWTNRHENCTFEPSYSEPAQSVARRCWPSVDRCPNNETISRHVSELCSRYQQPVFDTSKVKGVIEYKNPHCAVCHGVSTNDLACRKSAASIYKGGFRNFHVLPSLSMVIEINFKAKTCVFPLIWDGLINKCRPLFDNSGLDDGSFLFKKNVTRDAQGSMAMDLVSPTRIFQGYLSSTCVALSAVCLLFHILLYHLRKSGSASLPSRVLYSFAWAMLLSQVFFQLGVSPPINVPHGICYGAAVSVHFFLLLTFFWMNVMSFDVWRTFSSEGYLNDTFRNHTFYTVYAFGGASIILILSIIADTGTWLPIRMQPDYAVLPNICWFSSPLGAVVFLNIPALILVTINTIFFTATVAWFQKQSKTAEILKNNKSPGRKDYVRFWLYVKLSTIMGITWMSGAVASVTELEEFWYPFILLNGLQGVFIFFMFNSHIFSTQFTSFRCCLFPNRKTESFSKTPSVPASRTSKTVVVGSSVISK